MQRSEQGGIIISCDFCGTDWDPYADANVNPMVEGHHGSVICLSCVKLALPSLSTPSGPYRCTMCIQDDLPVDRPRWFHPSPTPSAGLNDHAIICRDCLWQAAGKFSKDPDVDWRWDRRDKTKV